MIMIWELRSANPTLDKAKSKNVYNTCIISVAAFATVLIKNRQEQVK